MTGVAESRHPGTEEAWHAGVPNGSLLERSPIADTIGAQLLMEAQECRCV